MPISCESQYILDSLHELLGITADAYEYVWSHQLDIDGYVDENLNIQENVNHTYNRMYPGLSLEERTSLGLEVLLGSDRQLDEFFKHLAGKLVDAYYRGTGKEFPRAHRMLSNRETTAITDLHDLDQIMQVAHQIDSFGSFRNLFGLAFDRAISAVTQVNFNSYIQYKQNELYRLQLERENLTLNKFYETTDPVKFKRRITAQRKQLDLGKKVLKKSLKVLESFMGKETSAAFIHGDKVEITGANFKFIIQKSEVKMIAHSASPTSYHVPYQLTVTDRQNVVLGQACLLFRDTPMLDQILAIHLHVMAGKEDELIKTASFSKTTDAFHANSHVERIRGKVSKMERGPLWDLTGVDDYFALRNQTSKYLIETFSQQLIGLPRHTVEFLMNPTVHKHEILQNWSASRFTQLILPLTQSFSTTTGGSEQALLTTI